tara:strand:- start:185 stop:1369 length:1185 start_codon:yes stop_codon:yes gene_type:complete
MSILSIPELETPASRVLYINSADATTKYGNISTDFDFSLEEAIQVPEHHSILLSLYSAEIPYSFYNFDGGINTRLSIYTTNYGVCADYTAGGLIDEFGGGFSNIDIPEGNYNAVQLANQLTTQLGIAKVSWNPITLKFDFVCTTANRRLTIAISGSNPFTVIGASSFGFMFNELGFKREHANPADNGDLYVEWNGAALWGSGYSNGNPGVAGPGIDTPTTNSPFGVATPLVAENVGDLTASVRSLFLRTNLSTNSVLDSNAGGGFSNILTRIPINTESGGMVRVEPMNGSIHKLLLKVKAITNVSVKLTNQLNNPIDLNGLDFDISLKMDFIDERESKSRPTLRELFDKFSNIQQTTQPRIVQNPRPDRLEEDKKEEGDKKESTKKKKTKKKKN